MKLIDRECAITLAHDICIPLPDGVYKHRCIDPDAISELPTIDAVPVVRCKYCKHWNSVMKESDFGLCDAWVTLYISTGGEEYCKRGEAKED